MRVILCIAEDGRILLVIGLIGFFQQGTQGVDTLVGGFAVHRKVSPEGRKQYSILD